MSISAAVSGPTPSAWIIGIVGDWSEVTACLLEELRTLDGQDPAAG
ncbi:MAG: hypothetical protein ACYCU3_08120 [Streptosporangiaceae bacterium]